MIIDGKKLADVVLQKASAEIKEGIAAGKKPPKLVVFTVQPTEESKSYMGIKRRRMEDAGGICEIVRYNRLPSFQELVGKLGDVAQDSATSAVIVQIPLPAGLGTSTLLDYIPTEKEVEGFKKKSPYAPPIGLAVLTMLKSVFSPAGDGNPEDVLVDIDKDVDYFRTIARRKKVVVIGNGVTGGQPVGATLSRAKIGYINLDINTPAPEDYLREADIIISCVGKNVVKPENVKQGAVLISVGLHLEDGKWIGDYDEAAIEGKALAYSPTPGGVGPLNVAYLISNVVKAWKEQK